MAAMVCFSLKASNIYVFILNVYIDAFLTLFIDAFI